jgi:N-formylglutamate deformylase
MLRYQYSSPEENPEVNLGTKNINRDLWAPVVETLLRCFREFNFEGRHLDVRENVKFGGGFFSYWLYERYGDKICVIALEFKKFFMDEWTGEPDERKIQHIRALLIASINPAREAAETIKASII